DAFKWASSEFVGVTWPGGAKAILSADFGPLAGRDVIILPDNDSPGEAAADQLVELLHEIGVRRLRRWKAPAECRAKWDIADDLPKDIDPGDMVKSILDARDIAAPRMLKTLSEFLDEFIAPDYLI